MTFAQINAGHLAFDRDARREERLAAEVAETMDVFRTALRQNAWFGLKAPTLPPMDRADADMARADVQDHYWSAGFTGNIGALDFSKRCFAAIEAAHAEWCALNPPTKAKVMRRDRSRLRVMLAERDGCDCWVCGRELGEDRTIEHVEARANGGTWAFENLRLAHGHCNQAMGALPVAAKEAARRAIRA